MREGGFYGSLYVTPFSMYEALRALSLMRTYLISKKSHDQANASFRLGRNLSWFSEGFPTRFACGKDGLLIENRS